LQCSPHHVHIAFHASIDSITRSLGLTRDQPVSLQLDRLEALVIEKYGLLPSQAAMLASMLSLPIEQRYGPPVGRADDREREAIDVLVAMARPRARLEPTL